jgi:hypothetical protein
VNVTVEGRQELVRKLDASRRGGIDGATRGLRLSGEDLLGKAIGVTPLDEATLRQSGSVQPTTGVFTDFGGAYVTVGFDTEYALAVHEMPDGTSWTTPGTGSKYLESPFAENEHLYIGFIKEQTLNGIWGGVRI